MKILLLLADGMRGEFSTTIRPLTQAIIMKVRRCCVYAYMHTYTTWFKRALTIILPLITLTGEREATGAGRAGNIEDDRYPLSSL